jgi:hypothetical protein
MFGTAQIGLKPVLGIAEFTTDEDLKYASTVAERVVTIVTNTKRFTVVDRTSYDKVKKELEFQKSEAFLDSKDLAKQTVALAAQYLIIGHIIKMNVYRIKNTDGSINGYKASAAFTLKVNEVETGKTTEAENFQTEVSPLMLSPESAVNEALNSIDAKLNYYFVKTFPLITKISKILAVKRDIALKVLISGGKQYGFKQGDELTVEKNELIDEHTYSTKIGLLRIVDPPGDDFSECHIVKGGQEILSRFNAAEQLTCKLIVK